MAGVKGRSGGTRPGAGRKPKTAAAREEAAPPLEEPKVRAKSTGRGKRYDDPISYLRDVVNDRKVADSTRVIAARSWAQLENAGRIVPVKPEPKGKKQVQREAAAEEATGASVFAMRPPPRLVG
jgi:hypothetical protein